MFKFGKVTAAQERVFERENVSQKRERYLSNNPIDRFENDPIYKEKVIQLKEIISCSMSSNPGGLVLDLGGNTGGESTVLSQQGIEIVLSDINELALEVAQERAKKFDLNIPLCAAADVHALPFADDTFQVVMVVEALHHFEYYDVALTEISRVLRPGGTLLCIEPIGWNPVRRLSEIRDRFRGTIEKSFTKNQLQRLFRKVGLENIDIKSVPSGRPAMQMIGIPFYRLFLSKLHAWAQQNYPRFLGNYRASGTKPGQTTEPNPKWPDFLRSPGGLHSAHFEGGLWKTDVGDFPDVNGIPVIISSDKVSPSQTSHR